MGRPSGSRNADFDTTRAALVRAAQVRLSEPDGARVSFRELAAAAGVNVATLRHYFGSREGVIEAVMAQWNAAGQKYMLEVATGPLGPVRASLEWLLAQIGEGFRFGLDQVHAIGLGSGLRDPLLGPAYLREVFDPTVDAVEARLSRHVARGELRAADTRQMALTLLSAPILVLLHQGPLGGAHARPLSYADFCEGHLAAFLCAYGTGAEAPA